MSRPVDEYRLALAPVLAIHGSASTGRQWKPLAALFEGEREVLAPDLPGYGATDSGHGACGDGLPGRVAPLVDLLIDQSRPVHLVAHSFGGAIALELMRYVPEAVRSMWLYEPVVPALLKTQGSAQDTALFSDLACLAELLDRASSQVAMASFVDFWHGLGGWSGLPATFQQVLAAQSGVVLRDFREAFLQSQQVFEGAPFPGPVNIVVGGCTKPHAARMAQILSDLLPGSHRITLDGLGHMGPCEEPDRVNPLIKQWIRTVERGDRCEPGSLGPINTQSFMKTEYDDETLKARL